MLLIIDGETRARQSAARELELAGHVVREASSFHQGLARVCEESFHAVLVNAHLPDGDGLELLREAFAETSFFPAILMVHRPQLHHVLDALRVGALDVLERGRNDIALTVERTLRAASLRGVGANNPATPSRWAERLRAAAAILEAANTREEAMYDERALGRLSKREREVALEAASGSHNGAIAAALDISPNTVKNHLKSIYFKLQVHNRTELVMRLRPI